MHKLLVTTLLLINFLNAQDIITYKNGRTLKVYVKKVGAEKVYYAKHNNPNGPQYSIDKGEIEKITYEGGEVDNLKSEEQSEVQSTQMSVAEALEYDNILWDRRSVFASYHPHDISGRALDPEQVYYLLSNSQELLQMYRKGKGMQNAGLAVGLTGGLIPMTAGFVRALRTGDYMPLAWGTSIGVTIACVGDVFSSIGYFRQFEALYEHNKKLCLDTTAYKSSLALFSRGQSQYVAGRAVTLSSVVPLWIGTVMTHNLPDSDSTKYLPASVGIMTGLVVALTGSIITTASIKKMVRATNVLSHPDKYPKKVSLDLGLSPNGAFFVMKF